VLYGKTGPAVRFAFPVTGGLVTLSPLGGDTYHAGGIVFRNTKNGKKIEVSQFTIDLTHGDLTGIVNGNASARVPLFRLGLSHAQLALGRHLVTARGIVLTLTSGEAKAFDAVSFREPQFPAAHRQATSLTQPVRHARSELF
jgi:hypothetical protein